MAKQILGKKFLSDLKLYTDYFKWREELGRYENWPEACEDITNGHRVKYNEYFIEPELESVLESLKSQTVLASQRNLQFRNKQLMAHNARIFNCLSGDTKFITDKGVFSFEELGENSSVKVWTHKGRWQNAIVKKYGKQKLNKIHFLQGVHGSSHIVRATNNHRWILSDETTTESIKVGDKLVKPKSIFNFNYDEATPLQRLYWCYGYVYGDGTKISDKSGATKYSMVRLCGDQVKYLNRFQEMGFKDSSPLSISGDIMIYTGKYLKTLPDIEKDNLDMMQAFVCGYLDADGEKNRNESEKLYNSIQSSSEESIEFIRKVFPSCGFFISKEYDYTGQKTNYGIRPETIRFSITNSFGSKYNRGFVVDKIEEDSEEEVWCLEVEEDHSFTLSNGIVTGNCTVVHVCRPKVFQEIFYLGLCGCGVGASLLKPFVNCLPEISLRSKGTKTYVIEDSIEGWADALGVLMSSYFVDNQPFPEYSGYEIKFDYSLIRPKGAMISGGFKAPGPTGLQTSLETIEKLLESWCRNRGSKITPVLAFDIICHASDAVLSGGVRRSALSMIVDPSDQEMIMAKTGNWRQDNPQRARSNNSVLIPRNSNDRSFFDKIVGLNEGDNDIGFVFCNTWFDVFNPCFTIDTKVLTNKGWRTFEQLLRMQESGEDIYIAQDKRTNGYLDSDGKTEYWLTDLNNSGTRFTKIGKVGKTGDQQDIYKLNLSCGRSIKATGNHKISTKRGMIELKDLIPGEDKVLIGISEDKPSINKGPDYRDGFLVGLVIGDGFIGDKEAGINVWYKEDSENSEENRLKIESLFELSIRDAIDNEKISSDGNKPLKSNIKFKLQTQVGNDLKYTLSSTGLKKFLEYHNITKNNIDNIHSKNTDFKAGFIAGMFFTDGHVDYNKSSKSISCRITQSNKELLDNLSLVLQELGIMSSVYDLLSAGKRLLPDSNRNLKEYDCRASYRLVIPGMVQMPYLLENMLYLCDEKIDKLQNILCNSKKFTKLNKEKTVVNIEYVGKEDVYCLEENAYRTLIVNGITAARCFEIGFTPVDTDQNIFLIEYQDLQEWTMQNIDLFGIQMCNLNEINAEKCQTEEQFLKACKDAAILGTLQAGYTSFPYLGERTESLVKREALLGVSITGWMNNPKLFNKEWLQKGVKTVVETNKAVAAKLGINQAARTTCVKPSGNASVILGTASGIHPEHSERYFRIMQINKESDTAKWLLENANFLIEESVWSRNNTDYVVFVPVINPKEGLFKKDMKGVTHLELIRTVQENWIVPGTNRELGICPLTTHNCSCTVIVDNQDEIVEYIWKNKESFTAVSFISDYGDKDFNQAPFTSVLSFEEITEKYGKGALFASGLIVDGLHYFNNNLWQACDSLVDNSMPIIGTREQTLLRKDWLRRAKQFAKNYFKGDIKTMVYCLKDIHLFHKFETINRNFKEIDFGQILKKPEFKYASEYAATACSGPNGCEITRI